MKLIYQKKLKQTLWVMLIGSVFLMGMMTLMYHDSSGALQQWLEAMNLPLTLIRCSIYVLVLLTWPRLMRMLARHYQWTDEHLADICAQRYKLFIWLVILELVLAQNIIGRFINLFF